MPAPALIPLAAKALAANKGARRAAAVAAVALLVPALLLVALFGAGAGGGCAAAENSGAPALSDQARRLLNPKFVAIYIDAGERFRLGPDGWAYLASIHGTENNFADSGGSPTSNVGAQGPMQFMPGTWATYKADGDGDGITDVQNVHDAIFAAANYLRASGAPASWQDALFAYNRVQWYVDRIRAGAIDYLGDGAPTELASTNAGACSCATGAGDSAPALDGAPTSPLPATAKLAWPTSTRTISSPFGIRWGRLHAGIDIPLAIGTPLRAPAAGRVTDASSFSGYGNYTCIQHATALTTCYGHQDSIRVRVGETVAAGQVIGLSGNTGASTGPHLHFEVRRGAGFAGTPVDPIAYLSGAAGPAGGTALAGGPGAGCPDTQLAALEGGSLAWPTATRGQVIGRPYQGTHNLGNWQSDNAIDIAVPVKTPIVAVEDGVVCASCGFGGTAGTGMGRFDGLRLTLTTPANQVFYAHLQRFARGIRPGARVRRGQVIAYSWSANGVPHLHIAVKNANPLQLFGVESPDTRAT